jgi:hypothetical protein
VSSAIFKAKQSPSAPTGGLVKEAFRGLEGEVLDAMPQFSTVRSHIGRKKRSSGGTIVDRKEDSRDWPAIMKQTLGGENFLVYDSCKLTVSYF